MDAKIVMQMVEGLHREKDIDKEDVFHAIEEGLATSARRRFGEEDEIRVEIDRKNGKVSAFHNGEPIELEEDFGRIGAQTAKQIIMQKIREAERDKRLVEYRKEINQLISGTVNRVEKFVITVQIAENVTAILPKSEQIGGEVYQPGDRVRAVIAEVDPRGNQVKIVLSRSRGEFVKRLFEQEIPEINEQVIEIHAIAREAGRRTKIAVSSTEPRVDPVGACVGMRGSRIQAVRAELSGEQIDIIRYQEDPKEFIRESLKPGAVDQVLLCRMLGRAIALVQEDQRSLAIGTQGRNVRLASKLCGWDIDILTAAELEVKIDAALTQYMSLPGMTEELANALVAEGYLSYDDLSVIEPEDLMALGNLDEDEALNLTEEAEERALVEEDQQRAEKARRREEDRIRAEMAAQGLHVGGDEEAEGLSAADAEHQSETEDADGGHGDAPAVDEAALEDAEEDEILDQDGGEEEDPSEEQIHGDVPDDAVGRDAAIAEELRESAEEKAAPPSRQPAVDVDRMAVATNEDEVPLAMVEEAMQRMTETELEDKTSDLSPLDTPESRAAMSQLDRDES